MFNKPVRASVGLVMTVVGVAGALLLLLLIVYGYLTEREWVGVAGKSVWD